MDPFGEDFMMYWWAAVSLSVLWVLTEHERGKTETHDPETCELCVKFLEDQKEFEEERHRNTLYKITQQTFENLLCKDCQHTVKNNRYSFKLFDYFEITPSALDAFIINFEDQRSWIFDNISLNLFLNFFFIILLFSIIYNNNFYLKNNIAIISAINGFLIFFFDIFKTLIKSIRLERFFVFILSIFTFILFQNLGGFSLFEVSFTSHAVITLFLSFIIFFNYLINYLINFNEKSHEKFVQKKLNIVLILVLFLIELVSFFVRPFSLGVRLFANILSGHILMHIFFNAFLYAYKMFFWLSLFLLLFSIFILTMEIFVSCVQSYIFLMLSIIYLQDVEKTH